MLKHVISRVLCPWKWSAQKRGKRLVPTASRFESRVKLDHNLRKYGGRVRARMWKAEWKTSLCLPKSNSLASEDSYNNMPAWLAKSNPDPNTTSSLDRPHLVVSPRPC